MTSQEKYKRIPSQSCYLFSDMKRMQKCLLSRHKVLSDVTSIFLIGPLPASVSLLLAFNAVLIPLIVNYICSWLDSNHGSLVLEATALPIVPQPTSQECCYIFPPMSTTHYLPTYLPTYLLTHKRVQTLKLIQVSQISKAWTSFAFPENLWPR